jgi:hypothetical protein
MRCLTDDECAAWCREHGYPVTANGAYGRPAPLVDEHFNLVRLALPDDAGRRVSLARDVIRRVSQRDDLLLWIDQWDIWPSSQHPPLFTRFRQAFGETRPLIAAPGHHFEQGQFDDGLSVLIFAMLFSWDCHVLSASRGPVFFTCHDEWSAFFVPPEQEAAPILASFSVWLEPDDSITH